MQELGAGRRSHTGLSKAYIEWSSPPPNGKCQTVGASRDKCAMLHPDTGPGGTQEWWLVKRLPLLQPAKVTEQSTQTDILPSVLLTTATQQLQLDTNFSLKKWRLGRRKQSQETEETCWPQPWSLYIGCYSTAAQNSLMSTTDVHIVCAKILVSWSRLCHQKMQCLMPFHFFHLAFTAPSPSSGLANGLGGRGEDSSL